MMTIDRIYIYLNTDKQRQNIYKNTDRQTEKGRGKEEEKARQTDRQTDAQVGRRKDTQAHQTGKGREGRVTRAGSIVLAVPVSAVGLSFAYIISGVPNFFLWFPETKRTTTEKRYFIAIVATVIKYRFSVVVRLVSGNHVFPPVIT